MKTRNFILMLFVAMFILLVNLEWALAADKFKDLDCETNQIAKFDGTTWVCADDEQGGSPGLTIRDDTGKIFGDVFSVDPDLRTALAEYNWEGYDLVLRFGRAGSLEFVFVDNIASWGSLFHLEADCSDGPYLYDNIFDTPEFTILRLTDPYETTALLNVFKSDPVFGELAESFVVLESTGPAEAIGNVVDPEEYPNFPGYFFVYRSKILDGAVVCDGIAALSPDPILVRPVEIVTGKFSDEHVVPFKVIKK